MTAVACEANLPCRVESEEWEQVKPGLPVGLQPASLLVRTFSLLGCEEIIEVLGITIPKNAFGH